MHDQANELRQLVERCTPQPTPSPGKRPRLVVLAGGKGGVGSTTLAVNLALTTAREGIKTVLVDADPKGGNVAILCGLVERYTLADVLAGRRSVREALQPGPDDRLSVLPGVYGLERLADFPPAAGKRLLGQLAALRLGVELVLVDAGNHPGPMAREFWTSADQVLAVTTPDTAAIIDVYAAIKSLAGPQSSIPIYSLVNQAPAPPVAESVYKRLARACQRFLGIELHTAGHVPDDPLAAAAGRRGEPFVLRTPLCDAKASLEQLAHMLRALGVGQDVPTETTTEPANEQLRSAA